MHASVLDNKVKQDVKGFSMLYIVVSTFSDPTILFTFSSPLCSKLHQVNLLRQKKGELFVSYTSVTCEFGYQDVCCILFSEDLEL